MNIDWTKIKEGFNGFEKLAVEFVQEHEHQSDNTWIQTKGTRDKNHDAIMSREAPESPQNDIAIFVGYSNNADVWWMEAKYSAVKANNNLISRYRLDATIVSAVLSKNISKIVFITNLNISSKTISDIRNALIFSNSCKEVIFYTRNHLENWILNKPYSWFADHFEYEQSDYNKLSIPVYNCIEELSLYNIGNNLFQEPLTTIYTNFVYEMHFSISVQKDFCAKLEECINIELLSDEACNLKLKVGINEFIFNIKIPQTLECEPIYEKDAKGEYKDLLPISLTYILSDENTCNEYKLEIIPSTFINIINSDYFYLDIPSQKNISELLFEETLKKAKDSTRYFSLLNLYGKSGIGKSYALQLYRNKLMEFKCQVICNSYSFSGNQLDDISILKKFVFNLFFPYIFYEDLDDEYIKRLQRNYRHLNSEFWKFIYYTKEIDEFVEFCKNSSLLNKVFPKEISINNRIIIFDDIHKLSSEHLELLDEMIKVFIRFKYPIFFIIVSQNKIDLKKYRITKEQYLRNVELIIEDSDIKAIFSKKINFVDFDNVSILFGSIIEIIYFIKYLSTLNNAIKTFDDFKVAYGLYKESELLKNEIISKFRKVFKEYAETEELCSCIYYTSSGIHRDIINNSKKLKELINILLDAELIKKNENDFFVSWHDYYKEIYISNFPLKVYKELDLPFKNTYDTKLQFDLNGTDDEAIESVIEKLQTLYSQQKYYSIYYILENVFLNKAVRIQYKNQISTKNYFLLFAYFCYANTNAGTIYSGYDMFEELYSEIVGIPDITVLTIRYIILWEIINSLYENNKYDEALKKITIFNNMPQNVQNKWVYLFEWDYTSLKYAVNTVKMFIDSENGINCLDKVPCKEMLPNKDVAFSTYRLLLCNLTNDFINAEKILREYNKIIEMNDVYEAKAKYMYKFAVIFLDCIKNEADISEVIEANNLLKNDFINDYNRHIFVVAILALIKGDFSLCEKYRLEYIKTKRPMRIRQQAFQAVYSALINLYKSQKELALVELNKAKELFKDSATYLSIITHNIEYINKYDFTLENVEFYVGGSLHQEKYYIDIRMLY